MLQKTQINDDTAAVLLANTGSLWLSMSDAPGFLGWARSVLEAFEQVELDMLAQKDAVGVFTVPLYRSKLWTLLDFPQADIDTADRELSEFDSGLYSFDGELAFDQSVVRHRRWSLALPPDIVSVGCIVDKPVDPTVILTAGVDFTVSDGRITFNADPSKLGLPVVYVENEPVVRCWGYGSEQDQRWTFKQFGHLFSRVNRTSSESYRALVQQLVTYLQKGPTALGLRFALASLLGMRLVQSAEEVVEIVEEAYGQLHVITDANAYVFHADAEAIVQPGDTVRRGDVLVDSLQVFEGSHVMSFDLVESIAIDRDWLGAGVSGTVIFPAEQVDTFYQMTNGVAHVSFDLGGRQEDVDAFWAAVRAVEASTGNTVARTLRDDPGAPGEPTVDQIPATVSPMAFLLEHVLSPNGMVIYIKSHAAEAPPMSVVANVVRRMLPPHVFALVFLEVDVGAEAADAPTEPDVDVASYVGTPSSTSISPTSYFVDAFQV